MADARPHHDTTPATSRHLSPGDQTRTPTDDDLTAAVRDWIADDVDSADAAELAQLLADNDREQLAQRFAAPLSFGTAGLRGPLRAGPNGMNLTVVRRTAAGIAAWLTQQGNTGGVVVIGYDGRHRSHEFALDSANVFAAAGLHATLVPRALPTPVLAYSVRHLHAVLGVMVTASHNPPHDNGYKVYGADGAQIIPPSDNQIEHAIAAVGHTTGIPTSHTGVRTLDDHIVDSYVNAVAALVDDGPRDIRAVHTALHGVGTRTLQQVCAAAGFTPPISVDAQADPDPDFPTVAFPNPEEPGALD